MKRVFMFSAILSVIFLMFSACDSAMPAIEEQPYLIVAGNRVTLNVQYVQYIRTGFIYQSPSPIITIVSSTDELKEYYEDNRIGIYDGYGNLLPDENFLNAIAKYTDNFFAENVLIIVGLTENSGSNRHRVKRINENGEIVIHRLLPAMPGTADMASWSILIELDRSHKVEQYSVTLIDVTNY